MTTPARALIAGLCATLVLSACSSGSDGGSNGPTDDGASAADPAPTESSAGEESSDTIEATETATTGGVPEDSLPEDLLLPNMRSLTPNDLSVVVEEGERRLRFAGLLANVGDGPMLVRPRGSEACSPRQIPAQQVLYRDDAGDGTFQRGEDPIGMRRSTGCMLDHEGHDHWHFDAMARYTLRDDAGERLATRSKVSFCLRDNERAPRPAVRGPKAYFGECSARGDQGISPGWVDIYTSDLDSQWLSLSGVGRRDSVCLQVAADPRDQLAETDESDNATSLSLRIDGRSVRRGGEACEAA